MKTLSIVFAFAATLFFLPSCKKAATSSPSSMEYQIQAINKTAIINQPVSPGSILWTSGTASATMIKLEAKNSGSEQVEFKSNTAQQIDLFASVAASLGNVSIPAGTYTEVEFRIEIAQSGSNPALQLNGQFTSGTGVVTPVIFLVNSMIDIKSEQTNVTVTDNSSATALTTLNLALLTSGITQTMMNSATHTGGTMIISSSSNANLYNIISNNLIQSHGVEVHHH